MSLSEEEIFQNKFSCFVHKRLQNNQKLTHEEITNLFNTIRKHNIVEVKNDMLFKRIRKLVLFSRNEYIYNKYLGYIEREYKDLTISESLECISIFVEYLPEIINYTIFEDCIIQYLAKDSDRILLKEYLSKYKNKINNYDYFIKLINYNPNDILYDILKVLESKEIDIDLFNKLIDKMYVLDIKYRQPILNISLLKKVMTRLNEEELLYKVNPKELSKLKNRLLEKIYSLLNNEQKNKLIRVDMMNGKLNINASFNIKKEDIYFEKLPLYTGEHVIAIDEDYSEDLDGAFSIKKIEDMYLFEVYISDVPSYIVKHHELFNEAYNRGCSIYLTKEDSTIKTIDMLPPVLSHKYLSLRGIYPKNVIKFSFLFDDNGNICNTEINRVKTYINSNITPYKAQQYIDGTAEKNNDSYTIYLLKKLMYKVKKVTNYPLIKELSPKKIDSLVAFPSLLVNYYVGDNSEFSIKRNNGIYTMNSSEKYAVTSTPIRRFSSDINLMFFLNQENVVLYPNKNLYWIKDNIDEVINHLNEKEMISKFACSHSEFVKKYIKY